MTKEELQQKALSIYPEAEFSLETCHSLINVSVPSENLHELAETLKNDQFFDFAPEASNFKNSAQDDPKSWEAQPGGDDRLKPFCIYKM